MSSSTLFIKRSIFIIGLVLFALPAFASASVSVSIGNLSATNVAVGSNVSFLVAASGFSGPSYSLSDSFGGSSVSNADINSNGNFSWTPTSSDVGVHNITIAVNDSSGNTATAQETITVTQTGSSGPTIQGLSPGATVIIGQPVTFTVAASGFNSPVFSLSDSFSGSTVSNSDINSAGYFTWTPTSNDAGTHNLTIYVNDSSGHTGNVPLTITVNQPNIAITTINPGTTVLPNSQLTFTVAPQGFTNPSYTLSDSFANSSITNSDINSSGQFTWTPATSQDGSHTITVYATDAAGHSAQTTITVVVNSGVSVALTAPSPSASVAAGTAVSFNTYAYGFTAPAYTVQDSFSGTSLTNAAINSSGDFYWIPTAGDVGTHTIVVYATDAYGHASSAQTTITVSGSGTITTTSTTSSSSLSALETQLDQLEAQIAAQGSGSSSVSSGFTFQNELTLGETSSDVTQLQNVLMQQGDFSGNVTGYFGPLTQTAVEKFQTGSGISPVGYVGPATREALNAVLSGSSSTAASTSTSSDDGYVFSNFIGYGQTSNDVTELQKRLTALGFYTGPITGYFGDLTKAAVEKFQGAHGIDQVSYVGPGTRAALN